MTQEQTNRYDRYLSLLLSHAYDREAVKAMVTSHMKREEIPVSEIETYLNSRFVDNESPSQSEEELEEQPEEKESQ